MFSLNSSCTNTISPILTDTTRSREFPAELQEPWELHPAARVEG